jgi:hypothetical protein
LNCLSVFMDAQKICNLRGNRCSSNQFASTTGNTYYRLSESLHIRDLPFSHKRWYKVISLKDYICRGVLTLFLHFLQIHIWIVYF